MRLNPNDIDLLLITRPAFIKSFRQASPRDKTSTDDADLALYNSITKLVSEVEELPRTFPPECADYDLSMDDYATATEALEDILNSLDNLVDDSILSLPNNQSSRYFPRLNALKQEIFSRDIPTDISDNVLNYISHLRPGQHPTTHYRCLTREVKRFNHTMGQVFSFHMPNPETRSKQPFFKDRNCISTVLDDDKDDAAEIHAASKLCKAARAIAQVMSGSVCQSSHSAFIHLDGFEGGEIDTILTVCCSAQPQRCRAIRWSHEFRRKVEGSSLVTQKTHICGEIRNRRQAKTILRIRAGSDGSWERLALAPKDRLAIHTRAPDMVLAELLISKGLEEGARILTKLDRLKIAARLARSLLCLIGSPFLQDPWRSETMLCSRLSQQEQNNIYITGLFPKHPHSLEAAVTNIRSFILDLGALLWELFFVEKVIVTEDDEESDDEVSLFNALGRKEQDSRQKCVDQACLDIIENCLTAWCKDESDNETLRKEYFDAVLKPLQEYLQKYSPSDSRNKPKHEDSRPPPSSLCSTRGLMLNTKINLLSLTGNGLLGTDAVHNMYQGTVTTDLPKHSVDGLLYADAANSVVSDSPSWLGKFDLFNKDLKSLTNSHPLRKVKIAILDTGCDVQNDFFHGPGDGFEDRVIDGWFDHVDNSSEPVDEDPGHHGTALTCLLLRLAPQATIHIGRVAKNSNGLSVTRQLVAKAIMHAVQQWNVDIISLSFGFGSEIHSIRKAILEAERLKGGKILFLAAANNDGLNGLEMFPAFFESVISARGTHPNGTFVGQYDPRTWCHKTGVQYGTLAQDVPCGWVSGRLTKSGCSVATAIMAAIIAALISFVDGEERFTDKERHLIRTRRGVLSVFESMTEGQCSNRDRRYLAPWQLFETSRKPLFLVGHALSKIPETILDSRAEERCISSNESDTIIEAEPAQTEAMPAPAPPRHA